MLEIVLHLRFEHVRTHRAMIVNGNESHEFLAKTRDTRGFFKRRVRLITAVGNDSASTCGESARITGKLRRAFASRDKRDE